MEDADDRLLFTFMVSCDIYILFPTESCGRKQRREEKKRMPVSLVRPKFAEVLEVTRGDEICDELVACSQRLTLYLRNSIDKKYTARKEGRKCDVYMRERSIPGIAVVLIYTGAMMGAHP